MLQQLKDLWEGLSPRRRQLLLGATGSVFLLLIVLVFTLNRGFRGEVLFSRLHPIDAAAVLQTLEDQGIRYEIVQDGSGRSTILVPRQHVHRARIDLAAQGLPRQGSVGFELFDESQLGMTDDVRRINLRRAISGELERTIRAMDGIDDARVQVTIPENRLFLSEQQPATAAVMLTVKPGVRLTQDQIRAVQRLVGATVEGLDPDDVFVADSRGNPLSDQLSQLDRNGGLTSVEKQIVVQQTVSNEYARQVRTVLESLYGPGRVEALVNVQINFEMAEEIVKAFEAPGGGRQGLARSEQRIEETFVGTAAQTQGVPGVESNVPGYVELGAAGDSEYNRLESIINYELTQIETRRTVPPGAIKSLSVAVWIDGNLTEDQENAVARALQAALGLNPDRGDQVVVVSLPFAAQTATATAVGVTDLQPASDPMSLALIIGALVLLAIVLWVVYRRRKRAAVPASIDVVVGDDEEEPPPILERKLTPEERHRIRLQQEITAVAQSKPKEVAQLLKSWLTEE